MCEIYGKGNCVHATASGECNSASKICASCCIGSRYEKKIDMRRLNHVALIRELSAFANDKVVKFADRVTPVGYEVTFNTGNYGLKRTFTDEDLKSWVKLSECIENEVNEWLENDVPSEARWRPSRALRRSFAYDNCFSNAKEINNMYGKPVTIKKVIFNNPATIVLWSDGTKTIVKAQDGSEFDKEKGLAMAISKKFLGNKGNYYNEFKKHLSEEE